MRGSRRNTVYDLTSLRLHPDGLRVHQTKKNLEFGKYHQNIHDPRRQWIAADATGTYTVPKKYRGVEKSEPVDETLHIEEQEEGDDSGEENTRKRKRIRRKHLRSTKRKNFGEDDSFLCGDVPAPNEVSLEMPSQDLLKNLHYLAAKYYDENNQLINAPRRYHRERKRRRLLKQGLESEDNGDEVSEEAESNFTETEDLEVDMGSIGSRTHRDMYRVLDGSVLVAMGMFTQELIKKFVGHGRSRKYNTKSNSENTDSEVEAGDEDADANSDAGETYDENEDDAEVVNLDG